MFSFIHNLSLALLLGGCIGFERQLRQRVAGLRTNALVALGAAIFMVMGCRIGSDATGRIASYIISGMGFLGAGVILKDRASIRGLNTAATLWCTAAVGTFCGLGYIHEPIVCTVLIISVHLFLRPLSNKIIKYKPFINTESEEYHYRFIAQCKEAVENHIRVLFIQYIRNNNELMLHSISSYDAETATKTIIEAEIISLSKQDSEIEKIASFLTLENGVSSIKWKVANMNKPS